MYFMQQMWHPMWKKYAEVSLEYMIIYFRIIEVYSLYNYAFMLSILFYNMKKKNRNVR